MSHKLITGGTGSGKSVIAKKLCRGYKKRGIYTAVLDPMLSNTDDWQADFQTSDGQEFIRHIKTVQNAMLFVDESGMAIGKYNTEMEFLATQARHWGHDTHFIVQRVTQIDPIIREQCIDAFVFATNERSLKMLSEEFMEKALLEVDKFQPGEFIIVNRFKAPIYGSIDFPDKPVDIDRIPVTIGATGKAETTAAETVSEPDPCQHSDSLSQT